jgi:hypothetical protein
MIKFQHLLLATFVLATAGACHAASPDQVGTWVGKLKAQTRTTAGAVSVKSVMQLEIAADDQTTVTIDGAQQVLGTALYQGEGFFLYIDPASGPNFRQWFGVAHFKGTKMKGTLSAFAMDGVGSIADVSLGKFSLKKQQ